MHTMLCRNRVESYTRWKQVFDSHTVAHRKAGLRLRHLWRDIEDPNNVYFIFEVMDMDRARAFISDPASAAAGRAAGVLDGEVKFLVDANSD